MLVGDPHVDPHMWTGGAGRRGPLRKTAHCLDMEMLATLLCLPDPTDAPNDDRIIHYCWNSEGRPCCQNDDEAAEKCGTPLMNLLTSTSWKDAVESRWTNVVSVFKRISLGLLFGSLLARALQHWVEAWSLTGDSVAGNLAKLIAIDSGNFTAKTKLTLIRTCNGFKQEMMLCRLAIMTTVLLEVDKLQFAVLGCEGERLNLLQFLHPTQSPLIAFQQRLVDLLTTWASGPASPWELARDKECPWELPQVFGGARIDDTRMLLRARREVLQAAVGFEVHFGQRLEQAPYSCAWVCFGDDVPYDERLERVQALFGMNRRCLPPMCIAWRKMYKTAEAFVREAPREVQKWAETVVLSIDFSERAHNSFRLRLRSSGRGRDGKSTGNGFVCAQAHTCHCDRGGQSLREQKAIAPVASEPETKHLGGPYVHFHNHKLAAFKEVHAPNRPLTDAEWVKIETRIQQQFQEVKQNNQQEYDTWVRIAKNRDARAARRLAPLAGSAAATALAPASAAAAPGFLLRYGPRAAAAGKPPFRQLWSHREGADRREMVPHEHLMASVHAGPTPRSDREYVVGDSATPRAEVPAGWGQLLGCPSNLFGVCDHELSGEALLHQGRVRVYLNSWFRSLTAETVQAATELILLTSSADDAGIGQGAPHHLFLLLVCARKRPLVQYFAVAGPADYPCISPGLPALPCEVEIMTTSSRLATRRSGKEKIWIASSRQVAKMLFERCPGRSWTLQPVTYTMCRREGAPSLRNMKVTAFGPTFEPKKMKPCSKKDAAKELFDILSGLPASGPPADKPEEEGASDDDEDGDWCKLLGGSDDDGSLEPIVDGWISDNSSRFESDVSKTEDEDWDDASVASEEKVPTVDDYVQNTKRDWWGHVTCTTIEGEWKDRCVGKIGVWGVELPWKKQTIGCKCYLPGHVNCGTRYPLPRNKWPDETFIRWLWRGALDPDCTDAATHKRMLQEP